MQYNYTVELSSVGVEAETAEEAAQAAHEVLIVNPSFPDRVWKVTGGPISNEIVYVKVKV